MKLLTKILFLLITLPMYSQSVIDKEYIFDDFKYERLAFPATGDSSGSMFGKNPWITKKGVEYSRAWRRYEDFSDTNSFRKGINISIDSIGFSIGFAEDFNRKFGYGPQINSDFLLSEGTFAARIKFSAFTSDKVVQAFFLWSPVGLNFGNKANTDVYWAEYDFEFNNCWEENHNPRMKVGCNNYDGKMPIFIDMDCIARHNGQYYEFKKCEGSFMGHKFFQDNWFIYVFRVNKLLRTLEIEAFSDDEDLPYELWGGFSQKAGNWGRPYTIPNYFPQYKVLTLFTIYPCSNNTKYQSFKTDWYFYSPNPNLSGSEILSQVKNLRDAGIERINTTQIPTFTETAEYAKDNLLISGPLTASVCRLSKWEIEPLYKGRHVYHIDFKYRIYTNGIPGNWINIYKPEFEYLPAPDNDSLELMAIYKDEWEYGPDTLFHTCTFQKVPCDELNKSLRFSSLYPNPAYEDLNLEIEVLYSSEISLEMFDIFGNKVADIFKNYLTVGNYKYAVNTSGLAEGIYYIRAITPIGTVVCKFIKLNY